MISFRQFELQYGRRRKNISRKYALAALMFGGKQPSRAAPQNAPHKSASLASLISSFFWRRPEETQEEEDSTDDEDVPRKAIVIPDRKLLTGWGQKWVSDSFVTRFYLNKEDDPRAAESYNEGLSKERLHRLIEEFYSLPAGTENVTVYRGLCVSQRVWDSTPGFHTAKTPFAHVETEESSWTLLPEVAYRYAVEHVMAQLHEGQEECKYGLILKTTVSRDKIFMDISNTVDTTYTNSIFSPEFQRSQKALFDCLVSEARHDRVLANFQAIEQLGDEARATHIKMEIVSKIKDQFEIVLKPGQFANTTVELIAQPKNPWAYMNKYKESDSRDESVRAMLAADLAVFANDSLFCQLHNPVVPREH
jgi:hypothetical protein